MFKQHFTQVIKSQLPDAADSTIAAHVGNLLLVLHLLPGIKTLNDFDRAVKNQAPKTFAIIKEYYSNPSTIKGKLSAICTYCEKFEDKKPSQYWNDQRRDISHIITEQRSSGKLGGRESAFVSTDQYQQILKQVGKSASDILNKYYEDLKRDPSITANHLTHAQLDTIQRAIVLWVYLDCNLRAELPTFTKERPHLSDNLSDIPSDNTSRVSPISPNNDLGDLKGYRRGYGRDEIFPLEEDSGGDNDEDNGAFRVVGTSGEFKKGGQSINTIERIKGGAYLMRLREFKTKKQIKEITYLIKAKQARQLLDFWFTIPSQNFIFSSFFAKPMSKARFSKYFTDIFIDTVKKPFTIQLNRIRIASNATPEVRKAIKTLREEAQQAGHSVQQHLTYIRDVE